MKNSSSSKNSNHLSKPHHHFTEMIKPIWVYIHKSFVFFGRALKNSKKDFFISIQVLLFISLILSIIFYFVEHAAQPEAYNSWWQALVWTLTRYIGDPGHFADHEPVTIIGRHIDSFIGILNILIFAVPAGLVANGYLNAMEEDKRAKHLRECRLKILHSFKRVQTKKKYRVVPRNVSLISLAVKKNMTESDIIDTVSECDEFCLRNLGDSQSRSEHPQDRLVIEMRPLNERTVDGYPIIRTSYGIRINRQSNVTIVTPTADMENSTGTFAYYLAQFGGFNYVSRLFVTDVDERISYLSDIKKELYEQWEAPLQKFVHDIETFSSSREKWNIILHATKKVPEAQLHFSHKSKSGKIVTTLDEKKFLDLFEHISKELSDNFNLRSDLNNEGIPGVGTGNISVVTGAGSVNNAFILRLSYKFITWTDQWSSIIVEMAKIIKQHLEHVDNQLFEEKDEWKTKGCGFGDGDIQRECDAEY